MRSRRGWIVILGPAVALAVVVGTSAWLRPTAARSPQAGLPIAPCAGPAADSGRGTPATVGAWWSRYPRIGSGGELAGWSLSVGAPGTASLRLDLPAAALVSGPDRGRVVATADDGSTSTVRVLDAGARCQRSLSMDGVIARAAVLVPGRAEVLVHLLDRAARRDLGVWRVPLDGSPRSLVLAPVGGGDLRAVGIERVWATDLVLASDGGSLGVQSCDPETCFTRVLDLRRGTVAMIDGPQGGLVGIDRRRLVAHARCTGEPCAVVAWDLDTLRPATLVAAAFGAGLTGDGRLVAGVAGEDGAIDAMVVDLASGARSSLGRLEDGTEPGTAAGDTGIETGPGVVPLTRSDGTTTTLAIDPSPTAGTEVRP